MGEESTRAFMDVVKIIIQADVGFSFAALITFFAGNLRLESFRLLILLSLLTFLLLTGIDISTAWIIDKWRQEIGTNN